VSHFVETDLGLFSPHKSKLKMRNNRIAKFVVGPPFGKPGKFVRGAERLEFWLVLDWGLQLSWVRTVFEMPKCSQTASTHESTAFRAVEVLVDTNTHSALQLILTLALKTVDIFIRNYKK